jgi:hypothetical protein
MTLLHIFVLAAEVLEVQGITIVPTIVDILGVIIMGVVPGVLVLIKQLLILVLQHKIIQ